MNLHENNEVFENAIRAASDHLDMRAIFVEKDYWVTLLLSRFSEDIDLAILKSEEQTATQVRNLIRNIEKELVGGFEEIYLDGITSKQTRYRKTAYDYNKTVAPESVQGIQEKLILEINSFANPVPFKRMPVNSLIEQFLLETNQHETIEKYDLQPFELNVLVPESTLIEKILSLIRLSFYEDGIDKLKSKVRHFYDLYFLSNSDACRDYIHTTDFLEHFKRMFEEDKTKFDDPEAWQTSPYTHSPIFTSFDKIWGEVRDTYNTDFKLLINSEGSFKS